MDADGATRVFDRGELEKTLPPAKMPSGKVSAFTAEKLLRFWKAHRHSNLWKNGLSGIS